jgi:hypothetical protein
MRLKVIPVGDQSGPAGGEPHGHLTSHALSMGPPMTLVWRASAPACIKHSVSACILIRWILRLKGSLTNCIGAKPGANGTVSQDLIGHADMSRSASTGKLQWCAGRKSPAPRLASVAACAMEWKCRGAGGKAQARRLPGVRGA